MSIVKVKKENRAVFIKKFEERGFTIDKRFSREDLIKSDLPITIDIEAKEIGRMGNITCAAIASKKGMIMGEEEFISKISK